MITIVQVTLDSINLVKQAIGKLLDQLHCMSPKSQFYIKPNFFDSLPPNGVVNHRKFV